jgi:flagellar biosynthesis/type III secretory pathway protein FliH
LFNPTPQRAVPSAWTPNALLQPSRQGDAGFANTDWDKVPRLDYRTEKFRQLAVPDPARVVDDPSEFEPWQPQQWADAPQSSDAAVNKSGPQDASRDGHDADPSGAGETGADGAKEAAADASQDTPHTSSRSDASSTDAQTETDAQDTDTPQANAENAEHADTLKGESSASAEHDGESASAEQASNHADPLNAETVGDTPTQESTSDGTPPALDSAAVQEACETARQEGLQNGLDAGKAQGREEALEEARQEREAALAQAEADKAQALQQLREELEGEIEPLKRQLGKAAEQVQSLVGQPDKLYEHVKRLSLHLAEQLVLGELNMSSSAIERLIQRCLDELDLHGNHVVTVELNPQDKARLQERAGEMSHALSVQAVASLQPGSVRVMINDTLVEDLVGHRLEALARSLLVQPEVWREQSPFFRQPLAQRDTEVQDAPTRAVASRESLSRDKTAGPANLASQTAKSGQPLRPDTVEMQDAEPVQTPVDPADEFEAEALEALTQDHDSEEPSNSPHESLDEAISASLSESPSESLSESMGESIDEPMQDHPSPESAEHLNESSTDSVERRDHQKEEND